MVHKTHTGDGIEISPASGVIPVLKEIGPGQLKVVGTGFYVTRYGLFATAGHVLEDLIDRDSGEIGTAYVLEDNGDQFLIRRIIKATLSNLSDIALVQVENGDGQNTGPGNKRGPLALLSPKVGEHLVTYAYPENELLNFVTKDHPPVLKGDYFDGVFEQQVLPREHPYIPYPHYETTIPIHSGASGCPIFNSSGRIVAIACRGWDFRGGEHEGEDLSSIIPVSYFLSMNDTCARVPVKCWEYSQIPKSRRGSPLSFGELVSYGHVDFGVFQF